MRRKNLYTYIALGLAAAWTLVACTSEHEEITVPTTSDEAAVAVNTSRAEGTEGGDYQLMFWTGAPGTITSPFFHSLGKGTGVEQVDYYHYGDSNYLVTKGGKPYYYPIDHSPVYAVGFSPKAGEGFTLSTDDKTLTLADSLVGLVDVLSTQAEWGTEPQPFHEDSTKELQFKHTLVKLNFKMNSTKNITGESGADYITHVKVRLPKGRFANTWTLDTVTVSDDGTYSAGQGFVPEVPGFDEVNILREFVTWGVDQLPVIGVDTKEWYDLKLSTDSAQTACYVLANVGFQTETFSQAKTPQVCIVLPVYADWIRGNEGTFHLDYQGKNALKVPLYDETDEKKPVTDFEDVKPGDAYTIYITFDYNRIDLWAQKQDWLPGGNLVIPINPTKDN